MIRRSNVTITVMSIIMERIAATIIVENISAQEIDIIY